MGSLMAGWDSHIPDPKLARFRRNRSLTKEEIDAYWRQKKKTEEEHLKAIASPSEKSQRSLREESESKFQRSSSLPLTKTKDGLINMDKETSLENFMKNNCWWTRSNWAFLNEPPVLEGNSKTYTSQFHIANLTAPKSDTDAGISSY
ncbi:uncharacterized protein LOC123202682 isoform X2 [Mangifera indica]|uniref:uncharacterized protein LOC123202682 isoform X2 n=1 Tax=Mangifera indica TaxID=29780 RepID=UPI001CFA3573|nr:uncharacterized protein LOC123202682 isoform X2 [Mangifera indica]